MRTIHMQSAIPTGPALEPQILTATPGRLRVRFGSTCALDAPTLERQLARAVARRRRARGTGRTDPTHAVSGTPVQVRINVMTGNALITYDAGSVDHTSVLAAVQQVALKRALSRGTAVSPPAPSADAGDMGRHPENAHGASAATAPRAGWPGWAGWPVPRFACALIMADGAAAVAFATLEALASSVVAIAPKVN